MKMMTAEDLRLMAHFVNQGHALSQDQAREVIEHGLMALLKIADLERKAQS